MSRYHFTPQDRRPNDDPAVFPRPPAETAGLVAEDVCRALAYGDLARAVSFAACLHALSHHLERTACYAAGGSGQT